MLEHLLQVGLLVILVLAPTQYAVEILPDVHVSIVDPLVWLLFGLWLLQLTRTGRLASLRPPPAVVLVFLGFATLSLLSSSNRIGTGRELVQAVEYFVLAFLLFSALLRREGLRNRALFVFLGTAAAVLVAALVQYWTPGAEALEVRGTFGNRNVLGGYLALVLPLFFALLVFDPRAWRRVGWAVALLAGLSVILSAASLLAVCVALLLIAMLRSRFAFFAALAVLLLFAVAIVPRLPREHGRKLFESIRLFDDRNQVSVRYTEWQAATVMTAEHPWLGVGMGNYQRHIGRYYGILPNPTGPTEPDTQNLYLVLASSIGLPGAAAFLAMLLYFGALALRHYFTSANPLGRAAVLGATGGLVAFGINAVWSPLLVRGLGIPLAFVFSLPYVLERPGGRGAANGTAPEPS